jgi:hypothetical protein
MARRPTARKTVFVVQRLNWAWSGGTGKSEKRQDFFLRLPGATRIQSFPDADSAEAERRRLEEQARARVNPFCCGNKGLSDKTSLDADRLHDWLLDAGIEPPGPAKDNQRDWAGWWSKAALSPEQCALVWKALDRLRFYEVVERQMKPVVYVVVNVGWHYTDQDFIAEPEGGKPIKVFKDREAAERECEDSNDIARDLWEETLEERGETLDLTGKLERQAEPFGPAGIDRKRWGALDHEHLQEVPFYEVVEVELEP